MPYRYEKHGRLRTYISFIQDVTQISGEVENNHLSTIFDGTCRLGEALAISITFISDQWTIEQHLLHIQMLS